MGYDITAFVGQEGTFAEFRQLSPYITVAPLNQGFELVLNDEYFENALKLGKSPIPEEYEDLSLSQNMLDWVALLSRRVPVAFVNAHFFGGNGSQSAALWRNGKMVLKPTTNSMMIGSYYGHLKDPKMPINSVMHELGVTATPPEDEFEAIGFPKHRHNEDWFAAYTEFSKREYEPFELGNENT
ncbi:MAG: hypothetical protein LCI00_29645 [Chloroflexi bacterium]|nr:hypothetical protein [Chloroflexota bacterium]MCC6893383.1 hypothetical protein [Anaerolineae bacterium]